MAPLGFWYFSWSLALGIDLVRVARGGEASCANNWRDIGYPCSAATFSSTYGWVALVIAGLLMLVIAYILTRWILAPLRQMTTVVGQLGPTNLASRINARGPRDEARGIADAVDAMLERVAEGYEAQRRFAANASHELRTPLAVQRTLIEVGMRPDASAAELDLLSRQLLHTNERNADLIEALLVLAESDRGLAGRTPQDLAGIAAATVESITPTATAAGVTLTVELSNERSPRRVLGERALLERMVTNLVQNGVKYNDRGGWVTVTVAEHAVAIANSGPLVPPEQVSGLFEPFRRLAGDRLSYGGGAGLGLTIVRSIVIAHRGRVDATSRPDGGLSVVVTLPPAP
jgi:signal transduction histidine kinase